MLLAFFTCIVFAQPKPLKFIHITKTGGTSIEDFGKKVNVSWGRFHTRSEKDYGFWHTPHDLKSHALVRSYDWFMFVRNPFDRIVSEYWCKWGGKGRPPNANVRDFNSFLRKRILSGANDANDGHYAKQTLYLRILNISPDVILRLGHFESLQQDLQRILALYDIKTEGLLLHANSNSKPLNVSHLDDKTIWLIQTTYMSDFEIFGYDLHPHRALLR